jgi:hypothetical protein
VSALTTTGALGEGPLCAAAAEGGPSSPIPTPAATTHRDRVGITVR